MAKGDINWPDVRARFETSTAAVSFRDLGEQFGCSHTAIRKRAVSEGWKRSLEPEIQQKVAELVTGAVSTVSDEKRAEAIDAEAARRADVVKRHRSEWDAARGRVYAGLTDHAAAKTLTAMRDAFEKLKAGKIAAEALAIIQGGERRAWNITPENMGRSADGKEVWVVKFVEDPYADTE